MDLLPPIKKDRSPAQKFEIYHETQHTLSVEEGWKVYSHQTKEVWDFMFSLEVNASFHNSFTEAHFIC